MKKKNLSLEFQTFERSNQNTYRLERPLTYPGKWIQKGDLLADCSTSKKGELALGTNIFVGYIPWEGFNFEDAVLINQRTIFKFTSLHIEKFEIKIDPTFEKRIIKIGKEADKNGIIKIGSWVQEGDILAGKIIFKFKQSKQSKESKESKESKKSKESKQSKKSKKSKESKESKQSKESKKSKESKQSKEFKEFKLVNEIIDTEMKKSKKEYLRVPTGVTGRIIRTYCTKNYTESNVLISKISSIYIAIRREFQVGDKISGRHGNKGIISKILPDPDMPYLSNGMSLDVLLNPLGIPSRMNVGQIFECLLGLTGQIFQTKFQILCFHEINGFELSRSFVYSKLFELCRKSNQKWLFSKKNPGKFHLFDGRNGQLFDQSILVGSSYLMKLVHIVDEKMHARSTGPYSVTTQQPLRGRTNCGGQRFGEMEVWALQGFGCSYILQELLTIKSDDLNGRNQILSTIVKNIPFNFTKPESLRVILRELQCLCFQIEFC
uniref:DNA-directed RNA polymerase n=1 Tax=Callipsygma wilsonis TaxID=2320807 RepID=A0A386AZW0_9CHLO|nr:RNA polymerase b-subunit [Callipsygma wilsonis]AYC64985.1 RNA polymerase b-subunit [Callipsygma wilsonis]